MNKTEPEKLWGGRFTEKTSSIMERIGESISFDKRLYKQDIYGSLAHAKNLHSIGILSSVELSDITNGLLQIEKEIENGQFSYHIELEDIHMHIEKRLTDIIGETGKKLHTGRSRNDQVAQDVRLYIRDQSKEIFSLLYELLQAVLEKANETKQIVMPGYTHLQVAQPIRASHFFLSYFWAFLRDVQILEFSTIVNNQTVLGSGALAGVNYPTNRELLKEELGLSSISDNSIDAVSQRDHLFTFIFACTQFMVHASRLCEEIIIYSSQEFSFIRLPDSLTTGSSIMPQKKNPDIAELIRGKSARVIASLNHILILVKGLPLAYNRDLQEDKIALFDTIDNTKLSIEGVTEMIKGMQLKPEKMRKSLEDGFSTATDLADFLVNSKQIPFRTAHELVGKLVGLCIEKKQNLFTVSESDRLSISSFFAGTDYFSAISLENSTDKKVSTGGTSLASQEIQIAKAQKILNEIK
jgi:argininosuccinate lyase